MTKKRLIFTGLAILLVLMLFGLGQFVKSQTPLKLVSTDPASGATDVDLNKTITLTFNQKMAEPPVGQTGSGQPNYMVVTSAVGTTSYSGSKISFKASDLLQVSTSYTVTLTNVTSANHKTLSPITFTFKTGSSSKAFSNNPTEKAQTQGTDEGNTPSTRRQFIAKLPILKPNYEIDYLEATDSFSVQIIQDPVSTAQAQALADFRANGLDPTKETISFVPVAGVGNHHGP